jgi:hypothetical protein
LRRRPWRRYAATTAIIVGGLYTGYHYSYGTETPPVEPPVDGTANIWVDVTGGTCADSVSAVTYADATACSTLAAAVAAAEPGDKIAVRVGDYPFESIAYRADLQDLSPGCDPHAEWGAASTVNCIHIVPDGGDVRIRGLQTLASSLWLEGNRTGDVGTATHADFDARAFDFHITNTDLIGNPPPGADDDAQCNCGSANFRIGLSSLPLAQQLDHVIVDQIDSDSWSLYGAHYSMLKDSDVGPHWLDTPNRGSITSSNPDVPRIRAGSAAAGNLTNDPQNIVIDNSFFHEMNRTMWCDINNACHPDGLYISSGGPITFRNSAMSQVAGEMFFIQNFGTFRVNVHDVTVENSWFGCKVVSYPDAPSTARTSCGPSGTGVHIDNCGTTCANFLWRYNSSWGFRWTTPNFSNVRIIGSASRQIGSADPICSTATIAYNAWVTQGSGSNCGATNVNTGSSSLTSLFVSTTPGSEDFHLAGAAGSTVADDLVEPTTSDYTLTTDADGDARTAGSRDAGIDER